MAETARFRTEPRQQTIDENPYTVDFPRRASSVTAEPRQSDQEAAPAVSDSALVEQAKGVLTLRYGVGSYEALATLAQWSREAHVSLPELSRALVAGVCRGRVGPEERGLVRWLEQRLRTDIAEGAEPLPAAPSPADDLTRPGTSAEPDPQSRQALDIAELKRWRYASAVHAARAICRP